MADRGITLVASHNYCTRRIRCGISDRLIEKEERTIYVATRRGRDCKPEMLLGAVACTIRRAEGQYGWKPIDIAKIMGLEVRLIKVGNRGLVTLGGKEIYLEDKGGVSGCNWISPASEVAGAIAAALGTTVEVVNAKTFPASQGSQKR